jgi:predicted Zn-dependent protease
MKRLFVITIVVMVTLGCATRKKQGNIVRPFQTDLYLEQQRPIQNGASLLQAVIIDEKSEMKGIHVEYDWLKQHYPGYKMVKQVMTVHNKRHYDVMYIITADNQQKQIYFNITNFYGKI